VKLVVTDHSESMSIAQLHKDLQHARRMRDRAARRLKRAMALADRWTRKVSEIEATELNLTQPSLFASTLQGNDQRQGSLL
jgi:tRNA A37 N6-isopentenylltransferase MiaA